MTTKIHSDQILGKISNAYHLKSSYRPIKWNPGSVLTERRKEVARARYVTVILWIVIAVVFVALLAEISDLQPQLSNQVNTTNSNIISLGNEAYARHNFEDAQQAYRQAIQAGLGSEQVWENYDRALLMKTMNKVNEQPALLNPASSSRQEMNQGILQQGPTTPGSDLMDQGEWEEMKQQVYEWLGC